MDRPPIYYPKTHRFTKIYIDLDFKAFSLIKKHNSIQPQISLPLKSIKLTVLFTDEYFMKLALSEAQMAFDIGEVPIGCVVTFNDRIIARAHNLTEQLNDVTAHAEMQAITSAASYLGGKYLKNCTMYVTMEPCVMCAGALTWAQLSRLVIGAADPQRGYEAKGISLHPKTEIVHGVLENECAQLVREFFQSKRKKYS